MPPSRRSNWTRPRRSRSVIEIPTTRTRSCSIPAERRRNSAGRPTTPLDKGVAAAVAYYRERGIEETYTHLKLADEKQPAQ